MYDNSDSEQRFAPRMELEEIAFDEAARPGGCMKIVPFEFVGSMTISSKVRLYHSIQAFLKLWVTGLFDAVINTFAKV